MQINIKDKSSLYAKVLIIFLFGSLIYIPLLNDYFNLFREIAPKGTRLPKSLENISISDFKDKKLQNSLQELAKKRSGYWLIGVKLSNEIYLRLFSQTAAFPSDFPFGLTKDNAIFKTEHLASFNRENKIDLNQLTNSVKTLKRFQSLIKRRGKVSIFVITPNLLSLYPDLVPDSFTRVDRLNRRDHYKDLIRILEKYNVDYVDTQKLLLEKTNDYPFKLFSPSASHWNDVGSCVALKAVNEKLWSLGYGFRKFECNEWKMRKFPHEKDLDLAMGLNLFDRREFITSTPYIDIQYTEENTQSPPSVLAVGTSYLSAFMEHAIKWNLAKKTTMYFYYRRQRINGWNKFTTLRKEKINWDEVLNSDIIILNVGMSELDKIGYGFLEDAVNYLEKYPSN